MPNFYTKTTYYLGSIFSLLAKVENPLNTIRTFLGLRPPSPQTIRLVDSHLLFTVRGPMDIWSVKETFINRFYERYGTPIQDGWQVLDIGGGIGEFTIFAAAGRPAARVAAFEPFPESFELLKKNLQQNDLQRVQIFPEAIGAADGSLSLDLSGGEPLMIQSGAADARPGAKTITAACLSLQSALDRLGFATCDLLKLDCEGAEYSILMDAPPQTLRRVKRMVMEYHDNAGPRTHADLAAYLTGQGYRVSSVANAVHPHLGYLYAAQA